MLAVSNHRAAFSSCRSPLAVEEKVNAEPPGQSSGTLSPRRCDPHDVRRKYPDRWQTFLKAHFRSATEVGFVFGVDHKTARNWWEGSTGPQGWAVEYACREVPGALQWMMAA
jgi:hypothetical protein